MKLNRNTVFNKLSSVIVVKQCLHTSGRFITGACLNATKHTCLLGMTLDRLPFHVQSKMAGK